MKNIAKASLWLLLTGMMRFAAASCGTTKKANEISTYAVGKYGYIDKTGQIVIAPQFDLAYSFYDGLAQVEIDGKEGFIDKTGKMVIKPQVEYASNKFSDGLAFVAFGEGKHGFMDKTGKIVVEYDYSEAVDEVFFLEPCFSDGLCQFYTEQYGLCNALGKNVTEPLYDELEATEKGLFIARTNDKYGIIDKNGRVLVDFEYEYDDVVLALEILKKLNR